MTKITRNTSKGFTILELLIVIVVVGVMLIIAVPRTTEALQHARVNRTVRVVSTDLNLAFSLAARQRKPVRIAYDNSKLEYTISDRATGTVLHTRGLGSDSDLSVGGVTFSTSPVDVFPTGFASSALTVSVALGSYSRTVVMTRAGMVLLP